MDPRDKKLNEEEDDDEEEEEVEEEEEEEEEDDEEEEEEEPKLKYQRIGGDAIELLKKDASSCMAVHEKFLALGTHWGMVFILDMYGNEIKRFQNSGAINDISIDINGDFLACCSDDGKVVIHSLYTNDTVVHTYKRPVKAVAIDPEYSRKNTKQFVSGGLAGQLILNEKGWFNNKDVVLHAGEGTIHSIKWRGSLISWANDQGIKIYDCNTKQRITYIDRPKGSPRPDMYCCCMCWKTDNVLLIGWADFVKIAVIKEKGRADAPNSLPSRYVEIISMFQTEYYICGLAPFGEYLVILAYLEDEEKKTAPGKKTQAQRPELRIISMKNEEISSDSLSITGFEHFEAKDYRLEYLPVENIFYTVSPRDLVMAKPRDLDDHINWLLEKQKYEEALKEAQLNSEKLKEINITDIGQKYLAYLIQNGKYEAAAEKCPEVLGANETLWEKWVYLFADLNQLNAISKYIPTEKPQLSSTIYEIVLAHFIHSDHSLLLKTIRSWPPRLYQIENVVVAVNDAVKIQPTSELLDTLAELYTIQKKFDKALEISLRLKRGNVFDLIVKYDLFDSVLDKIYLLITFEPDIENLSTEDASQKNAIQLLVSKTDRIPVATVVNQLNEKGNKRKLLLFYLHALNKKDPQLGSEFHELQVSLYAEYEYKLLLPFLKQSNYYPLEKAYEVCMSRDLIPEMVFILGRMGNNKKALNLILDRMGDINNAIEFAKEQNDEELWEDLISHSMKKPKYITCLLRNVGSHIDPIKLIQRIPEKLEIPGLQESLVKILQDYNLQMSLREGCRQILMTDSVNMMDRLVKQQKRGISLGETASCVASGRYVFGECGKSDVNVVMFYCGHSCIEESLKEVCAKNSKGQATRDLYFCPLCQSAQTKKNNARKASSGK